MGPDSMRQPGSPAAANGTSAQAAAIGQQLSATGQHHCIMLWCHFSSAVRKVDAERSVKGIKWSVVQQACLQVLF